MTRTGTFKPRAQTKSIKLYSQIGTPSFYVTMPKNRRYSYSTQLVIVLGLGSYQKACIFCINDAKVTKDNNLVNGAPKMSGRWKSKIFWRYWMPVEAYTITYTHTLVEIALSVGMLVLAQDTILIFVLKYVKINFFINSVGSS